MDSFAATRDAPQHEDQSDEEEPLLAPQQQDQQQPQPAGPAQARYQVLPAQSDGASTAAEPRPWTRAADGHLDDARARASPTREPVQPYGDAKNEIITTDQDKGIDAPSPLDASSAPNLYASRDVLASPRHELALIPEDQPISTPVASPLPTSSILSSNQPSSNRASAASSPDTGIIARPAVLRPVPHPLPSRPSSRSSVSPISPVEPLLSPAVVRSASTSSVLRHPFPDINARSGSYTSNIAALEATAERFSMTSSIDDAIRDAHNELKRSDSRRSSILAASIRSAPDHDGPQGQSSIVGLNNAARIGGYSPGGYIMSPAQSITGRLRSGSKSSGALSRANSTRSKPETIEGEAFPKLSSLSGSSLSRSGPGKGSLRSVRSLQSIHSVHSNRSGPVSLAEIVEMEPPSALTLAAMEEADRTAPRLEDLGDDDDAILARAHQQIEPDATDIEVVQEPAQQFSDDADRNDMLDQSSDPYWDTVDETDRQLRVVGEPPSARTRDEHKDASEDHIETSGTPDTVDEDTMFADFDGMHCDPDTVAELFPYRPEEDDRPGPTRREPIARRAPAARPQSYFDPETNQQMLYYPARVPAMLNLPPKLGKGLKAAQAERNARRSQVLSRMPKAARESRLWLPDPLENEGPMNLMGDDTRTTSHHSGTQPHGPEHALAALEGPSALDHEEHASQEPSAPYELRRPAKISDSGARQSRLNLSELPPQLRASVFFDMPTETPKIVVKNGSAMDTLDSILDAAAAAPVNAFTDHAFAGHLGSEVYGLEKKRRPKSQMALVSPPTDEKHHKSNKSAANLAVPEVEKRRSVWSLLAGRSKSKSSVDLLNVQEEETRSRVSGSGRGDGSESGSDVDEHSALAPDEADEFSNSDDEQLYDGPPTTLLAELQMRKRQHKNRTKNPMLSGNGLHSTLLELDAVAQIEARQRKKKKINLAWAGEGPEEESEDDEDVPLGLLAVKKQLGPDATEQDLAIAAQELNRPLGLMEKRELDDNEPLSRRRDRLQGKPVPVSMYLQPGGNSTRMTLMPGNSRPVSPRLLNPASPALSQNSQNQASNQTSADEREAEGETLGERRRRLREKADENNPLPSARPVSAGFSEELLGELGIDKAKEDKGKGREDAAPVVEEEETLGQRRRRLQAEREAREKEMGMPGVPSETTRPPMSTRMTMADVLSSNPLEGPQGRMDPRQVERRRKEEEAARAGMEQEAKLRAFRAQMPQQVDDPGAGIHKPGGYQHGRFNDSMGGMGGPGQQLGRSQHLRASMSMGQLGPMSQPRAVSGSNLIGAAGNYNGVNGGPDGLNPVFAKQNPFGNGYNGGFMQQPQFQQPQPFVNGSLLASGGYGAFGGGIGAAGGYSMNQTAYGAGVGFAGGMHPGYGMQAGGVPMMSGQAYAEQVERWRQSIR